MPGLVPPFRANFTKACKHRNLLSTDNHCLEETGYQPNFRKNCSDRCPNHFLLSIEICLAVSSTYQLYEIGKTVNTILY